MLSLLALLAISSNPQPVVFTDLATPFERVTVSTNGQPAADRIAAVRRTLDPLLPGVYAQGPKTDRRIAAALKAFSDKQPGYDRAVRAFPAALTNAVQRFRSVFKDFTPPLPIYLYHSLGERDGGSAYLEPGHRPVMLFGADMIAQFHADDSLEPFMDHELFHLEHKRTFPDCDQFWCILWQEGLAVDAAATMNPGASDHQLLLDLPAPMRAPTNSRWKQALCFVASHFDDTADATTAQAMQGGTKPPSGLPVRFGYYVGYRLAQQTGRSIVQLDRLDHQQARLLLRTTLVRSMRDAGTVCLPPAPKAEITQAAPHPA